MKTKPLTFLLSLAFLFLFSGSVYGDNFQDGLDAYQINDYQKAARLWLPLAEQGDAIAQSNLGNMYRKGQGVPQNYKEAYKWYHLSAKQGLASGQSNLGDMYSLGLGVSQDYKEALTWYRLAAEQGNIDAKEKLSLLLAGSKDARDYFERDTSKAQNVVESSPLDLSSKEKSMKNHSNHFSNCTKEKVNFIEFKNLVIYPMKATLTCLLSPLSSTKPRLKSKTDWKFDRDVTDNQLAELDSSDKDVLLLYDSMFDESYAESVYPLKEGLIKHNENGQAIVFTAPESDVGVTHIKQISSEYIVVRASSHTWQSAYLVSTDLKKMSYLTNGSVEVVNLDKLIFKSRERKNHWKEGGAFWYTAILDRNGGIIDIDNEDLDPKYKACFSKSDFLKKSYIEELPKSVRDIVCVTQ